MTDSGDPRSTAHAVDVDPPPPHSTDPAALRLISHPFHNGLRAVGMGNGPLLLAGDGQFLAGIERAGWTVELEEVASADETLPEIARVIELNRRLAARVQAARLDGKLPLVLAGNCNSALGTVAGLGPEELGIVWFDAHADFDDPEENVSGFFDVMGLAMLTGRGWHALRHTIPGHQPVSERNVLLAAVRDLEPYQRARVERSEILAIPGEIEVGRFQEALTQLASRVRRVYLHIDLDSLDASQARVNEYAAAGGPSLDRLCQCVRLTCNRFELAAVAITAYNPAVDEDRRGQAAARRLASEIVTTVRRTSGSR